MKKFLFITPLTPSRFLTPLRKELFLLFLNALKNQTYDNWEALLFGEEEKIDGKIKFIKTNALSKADKFLVAIEYLKSITRKPDYIIRIDDDDLISPNILHYVSQFNFDCYADKYHAFYDITSGKTSLSKREWLANTVIHKFDHVLVQVRKANEVLDKNDNFSLLGLDHDVYWGNYYRNKKILWSDKDHPIYLRVLSPSSITSNIHESPMLSNWNGDLQMKFNKYTNGYGPWVYKRLSDFSTYYSDLKLIWKNYSGVSVKEQLSVSVFFDYLKYYLKFNKQRGRVITFSSEKESNDSYRMCSRCILDTQDVHDIYFDENGICNYCQYYDELASKSLYKDQEREKKLAELINNIKKSGKGREYDCIIGVSGGVDSTYLAFFVKKMGLRPLAVHLDYGWNSDLAVKNIKSILQKLQIDLYTYVVDWKEIKDLQLAFFKASVVDIELVNDFAILAVLHNIAYKKGIKYSLNGWNIMTEGGLFPKGWTWSKFDELNIRSIHKRFGSAKLKTYPRLSFWKRLYYAFFYKLNSVSILNYTDFNKEKIKEIIINELDWHDYGGKHFESVFTRFYQGYILPRKFGVSKRKFHLSVLICSGQLTKEKALEQMMIDDYPIRRQNEDKEYVLKKLELTNEEFEYYMNLPIKEHSDYPTYLNRHYIYHERLMKIIKPLTSFYARKIS